MRGTHAVLQHQKGRNHILMLVAISLVSSPAFKRRLLECALILVAACCHVSFTASLIGLSGMLVRGGTISQLQPVVRGCVQTEL